MSKKKHFHSVRSGKRQAQAYAFFHRSNAWARANSQAFVNLQNNGLPGATNTEQAEGGKQGLSDTDSTSNDTKETEKCKYELQSYIWHT